MKNNMHVRVDERLIHGQVALAWSNFLQPTRIMVVDDAISKDNMQLSLLKMVCPKGIKLSVLAAKNAAANILSGKYDEDKIFLLVKRPETLLRLWEEGIHIDAVNVGNMSGKTDAVLLKKDVCVTKENVETFTKLHKEGVKITGQTVPVDPVVDLMSLIEKMK